TGSHTHLKTSGPPVEFTFGIDQPTFGDQRAHGGAQPGGSDLPSMLLPCPSRAESEFGQPVQYCQFRITVTIEVAVRTRVVHHCRAVCLRDLHAIVIKGHHSAEYLLRAP